MSSFLSKPRPFDLRLLSVMGIDVLDHVLKGRTHMVSDGADAIIRVTTMPILLSLLSEMEPLSERMDLVTDE